MKIDEIPNIAVVAERYHRYILNRDYWKDATTREARELYALWDTTASNLAQVIAIIAGVESSYLNYVEEELTRINTLYQVNKQMAAVDTNRQ